MNIPGFSPALARTGAAEIWLSGPLPAKVQLVVKKVTKRGKELACLASFSLYIANPNARSAESRSRLIYFPVLKINECFCAPTRICQTTPDAQAKQPPSLASRWCSLNGIILCTIRRRLIKRSELGQCAEKCTLWSLQIVKGRNCTHSGANPSEGAKCVVEWPL